MIGRLLDFRLEARARKKATERALQSSAGPAVRSLADALAPGEAVAGLMVEHNWALVLADAVNRLGGTQLVSEFVSDTAAADGLPAMLLQAMARQPAPPA
jgi:hypothetical protein